MSKIVTESIKVEFDEEKNVSIFHSENKTQYKVKRRQSVPILTFKNYYKLKTLDTLKTHHLQKKVKSSLLQKKFPFIIIRNTTNIILNL